MSVRNVLALRVTCEDTFSYANILTNLYLNTKGKYGLGCNSKHKLNDLIHGEGLEPALPFHQWNIFEAHPSITLHST